MTSVRAHRASVIGLALLMTVVAIYVLHAGRGTVAHFDEWDWITRRRGVSAETLLGPHNGHLSLVPVVAYKLLLQTAGLDHYWVFRVVLVLTHLVCVVLVFLLARGRVGTVGAAFAAGFVAVLGSAGDDLLWAFQIGFVGGVAFGLGALLALDRDSPRGDAVAAVLLALSLASASVGAAFMIAVAVEVAADPERRRRRWWVIAGPLALYAAWYVGYGESELRRENLRETPVYAAESGSAAAAGAVGLTLEYGRFLLLALAAAVGYRVYAAGKLAPRFVALATAAPALWALTALSRAQFNEPAAPRYVYAGAVLLVLLVCELARGRIVPRPRAALVLGAVLAFAAVANAHTLDGISDFLRVRADDVRARLGALDLVAARVDPGFQPVPAGAPQIQARTTLSAERAFGHVGLSPGELVAAPQAQGAAADEVLVAAGSLMTMAAPGGPGATGATPVLVRGVRGGTATTRGVCVRTRPTSADARLDLELPDGKAVRITTTGATGVLGRRFARSFSAAPAAEIPGRSTVVLRAAADAAATPWQLELASAGSVTVCPEG